MGSIAEAGKIADALHVSIEEVLAATIQTPGIEDKRQYLYYKLAVRLGAIDRMIEHEKALPGNRSKRKRA